MPIRRYLPTTVGIMLLCCLLSTLLFFCQKNGSDNHLISEKANATSINFFYTGRLLGELEPCGCSGNKLGGMLLRSSWIDKLHSQKQKFFLIDGGFSAPKWQRQDQIKALVHHRILGKMHYDYQFLGQNENMAPEALSDKSPLFLGTNSQVATWYNRQDFSDSGQHWRILFFSISKQQPRPKEMATIIARDKPDVVFVMTEGIYQGYQNFVAAGPYLRIIMPIDAQEPFSPLTPVPNLLVISAGDRGRYAGLLQLFYQKDRLIDWQHRIIALQNGHAPIPEVTNLLEQYKQQLRQERLLELQIKRSSPVGFVGSENCRECHQTEYKQWQQKAHARAFATLVKIKHDYDPECVGCHVVGYDYEEGFRSPEETPHLIDVGCEACHGAGARHIINPVPGYGDSGGEKTCRSCHQKDRSPKFEYKKYREMIKHWKD